MHKNLGSIPGSVGSPEHCWDKPCVQNLEWPQPIGVAKKRKKENVTPSILETIKY